MTAQRILAVYRWLFVALILVASFQTLTAEHDGHATALAITEIPGALLLLARRTQWAGAVLLLVVFTAAQAISIAHGNYPTRFLQYAASTVLIVMLGRALASIHQ
jgi:hypothetical protein